MQVLLPEAVNFTGTPNCELVTISYRSETEGWLIPFPYAEDEAGCFGSLGLGDHEVLEREFIVYDSLYAECKRQVRSGLFAEVS